MDNAISHVLDTIDIETYIICKDADEGKNLAMQLGHEMNLGNVDVMYSEFDGYGVRVRIRKYVYKPGDKYLWMEK
jgi:alkyl hydroperoxide reductase subunit AhpF